MADESPKPKRGMPLWETAAILLAIASLWPAYVLPEFTDAPPHPAWRWVCYGMLALMGLVFVRRIVAFNRLAREQAETQRRAAGRADGSR
jgi:hypothetical protein